MINNIAIRSLQHYLYCPHRWGLLEIDRAWAENYYVTRANLMHTRVHDSDHYTLRGRKIFTGVSVYHDRYQLYGVVDCIEGKPSQKGVRLLKDPNFYELTIVEYKPTQPQNRLFNDEDLMQVFAQKLCVDSLFNCDCNAVIYYANTKKRVTLPLKEKAEDYMEMLIEIIATMKNHLANGIIPPVRKGQKCHGCSLKDLCMPFTKSAPAIRKQIQKITEDKICENF